LNLFQPDIWTLLLIISLGFAGGFLAGMLGVGGGIVFVPIFQEMVKNHPVQEDRVSYILANSLVIVFAVGISGTIKQYKLKNTDFRASLVTGIFAVISSLSASFLIKYYHVNDPVLFSYIFVAILVLTAARMLYARNKNNADNEVLRMPALKKFIPAGLFAGLVTGFTGLGGGVLMVPYFNKVLKLPIKFATGLSLSVIPMIALPLLLFYMFNKPLLVLQEYQTGHIVWLIALPIIAAAMLAAPLGVRVAHKLPPKTLTGIFLCFIVITIIKTLLT
jgi:uncharacterized membrane protein YfcA